MQAYASEILPIKQGLKPGHLDFKIQVDGASEILPIKQGLKPTTMAERLLSEDASEILPIKQGLKPLQSKVKLEVGKCLRDTSNKTRIET